MEYLRITEEILFSFNGINYIARTYIPARKPNYIYGEIVLAENKKRPNNMRKILREKLKEYNIDVPFDSKKLVTHSAVQMLMNLIKNEKA